MLEALDRGNLFLVPLDDRRQWYRYHQLFADVLRARLLDEQPERGARAAPSRERLVRAATAIAPRPSATPWPAGISSGRRTWWSSRSRRRARPGRRPRLRGWLEALPDELLRVRPVLSNAYAGSFLVRGEVEGVEERLRDAERWLGAGRADAADLPAERARWSSSTRRRSAGCRARSPCTGPARPCSSVMWPAPRPMPGGRSTSSARTSTLHVGALPGSWRSPPGRAGTSRRRPGWYAAAMASLEKAGHLSDVIGCALALADIRLAQGRLREALRIFERGLALATGQGGRALRGAADMHVGISSILRERDDLEGARRQLLPGARAGRGERPAAEPLSVARRPGRDPAGRGRPGRSARAAHRGRAALRRRLLPGRAPGRRPRRRGSGSRRGGWRGVRLGARAGACRPRTTSSYLHEFEHITLARLLLARRGGDHRSLQQALDLLERLLRSAQDGGRTASVIEILVLQALGHQARGDVRARAGPAGPRACAGRAGGLRPRLRRRGAADGGAA